MTRTNEYILPVRWHAFLHNGNPTGLSRREVQAVRLWCHRAGATGRARLVRHVGHTTRHDAAASAPPCECARYRFEAG